jgi:hypothetical protein
MLSQSQPSSFYPRKPKSFLGLILAAVLTVTLSPVITVVTHGQTDQPGERMVRKLSWRKEPVKIKEIKSKDKAIELGRKFSADDDWLKDLVVSVHNTSGKTILFIGIDLLFVRNNNSQEPPWSFTLAYGRRKSPNEPVQPDAPKPFLSGGNINISLYDGAYEQIKRRLHELNYDGGIKHIKLIVNDIYFADGSRWYAGVLFYPDPNDPAKWLPNTQSNDRGSTSRPQPLG